MRAYTRKNVSSPTTLPRLGISSKPQRLRPAIPSLSNMWRGTSRPANRAHQLQSLTEGIHGKFERAGLHCVGIEGSENESGK
jgi:hypothetical protein